MHKAPRDLLFHICCCSCGIGLNWERSKA
uniref:Uncharacterized protein n=1 Tax=Rhizophora mucronata TaxID=61149 RepID=A0A2P2IRD7_RHIMU